MITSPSVFAIRNSVCAPLWGKSGSGNHIDQPVLHPVPPSDPLRQAGRLPIKVLKMLTARAGHILHPEYLQPLPSTPISPIELDAKKSPLALLAQTCSQIGKPDPPPSSKLSSNGSSADKESKSGPLKMSDIGNEDKSSFKPYSKSQEKKDPPPPPPPGLSVGGGDSAKSGFRVPSATCQPFTPRTGSPSSCASASPLPSEPKSGDRDDKKDTLDGGGGKSEGIRINAEVSPHPDVASAPKPISSITSITSDSSSSSSLVAPVSPYKPGQTVFPLAPPSYAGAYTGYPQPFLPHGVALDPSKPTGHLLSAGLLGCGGKPGSSPLAGASPPSSLLSATLCRDPYCLSYHCAAGPLGASCAHDPLKPPGYPLVYPSPHPALHPSAPPSFPGHPLYPYGFMLPNDPLPHVCNWVSANGPCDKRFPSSEELLGHLRTHTAFADKQLLSGYPTNSSTSSSSPSSSSLAAAMATCHMHIPAQPGSPGTLALRSPHHHHHHHALGLSSRYHPYSKSPLPTPGAPVPVPAATGPYYSPYALYGQRLTTAAALGYQ